MNNFEIAKKLRLLSLLCRFEGEVPFKAAAYEKVADSLENSEIQITIANVFVFDGVGKNIADKLRAIIRTGTCEKLDILFRKHQHLLPLLEIPGIGPAKAKMYFEEYHAETIEDIQRLVKQGIITDKRIVEGTSAQNERMPFSVAQIIGKVFVDRILETCKDFIDRIDLAGSLRREKETVGDLDVIIATRSRQRVVGVLGSLMDNILSSGEEKLSGIVRRKRCQIRFVDLENYGAMLLHFTGSKEHNIKLRQLAISKGMRLNEYGLWRDEMKIVSSTEEEIFEHLGLCYIEPRNRT